MADHETFEQHLDIPLDDEPATTREPVYVDVVAKVHDRAPIVPAGWRGWDNIRSSLRFQRDLLAYRAGYHGGRFFTRYLWLGLFWAVVGVFRVAGAQIVWFWQRDTARLAQTAATKDNWYEHKDAVKTVRAIRKFRVIILLGEALLLAAAVIVVVHQPTWVQLLVIATIIPPLARFGRPVDRRIITPATVTERFRRINPDIVLRAHYAAGLGNPDKPDQQVTFASTMARDGDGSGVRIDLPYGKGFADVIKAKEALASGLDVAVSQVFLTRDRTSNRRYRLWVADRDPLAIPAGRTPLLDLKVRDIWRPAPFGLDERGNRVDILLMWISILVGAQPRKGKTFSARLLALYAALDPYVRITVADGKMSPDWEKFRLVAHRLIMGVVPNSRDRDPVGNLLEALREIKAHIQHVNDFLASLPPSECPEGKLTRELSRKYPLLRVWLLVMEEFQVYYELDDKGEDGKKSASEEVANLLSFIMAVGPSAGVIVLSSSQKPSGVGAGQNIARLFTRYRDNHAVRFALKCGNRIVSEAVLGGDAYAEGFDASSLPTGLEYRGVGYLYGLTDDTPTVRTYLADAGDAEKILLAARRHREAAGTLTGDAAGEESTRDVRDVLADVRGVFYAGEAWVSWPQIAARLAEKLPETYAGLTAESISAQARALNVDSRDGRDKHNENRVLKGARLTSVDAAMRGREISDA